jgi:hypothetical protein
MGTEKLKQQADEVNPISHLVIHVRKLHDFGVWDVTPCSLVGSYQRLCGTCRLHLQGKVT